MDETSKLASIASKYHADIDTEVGRAVVRLAGAGIAVQCRKGCSWCCRLPVRATVPEGVLVAGYLLEKLHGGDMAALKGRISSWLTVIRRDEETRDAWGFRRKGLEMATFPPVPPCPFLTDDLCLVYPVRPMGCRVHCTASSPKRCRAVVCPETIAEPELVPEVLQAVKPVCMSYRKSLEEAGLPFDKVLDHLAALVLDRLEITARSEGMR